MAEKTMFISGMVMLAMLATGEKESSSSRARVAQAWQILVGILAIGLCIASVQI